MELLVTVCLEWKHLADLACPCLHPRAGESPCGRCVPSCAAACRALHCSAALAGAHHQAGSGGARSRVLCGLGGWARCRMGLVAATLHLQKHRKIGCSAPLGCTTVCARGEGQRGAELSVHAASLQLCVPRVAASASQRAPRAPAAQNSSSGAVIPTVLARGSPSGTGREAAHRHGEMGNSRPRAAFFPEPAKKRDTEQTGEKKRKNKTHIGFRDGLFTGRIDAVCVQKS